MSPTGAKKKAAAKKAPSNARVVRRESNGNGNGADDGQRLVELTGLVERSAVARPLRGSLPMQLRVTDDDNGGSVEVLPAILYAPPHLFSNTGSTAPPSEGAIEARRHRSMKRLVPSRSDFTRKVTTPPKPRQSLVASA